jgi:hypothetical protein
MGLNSSTIGSIGQWVAAGAVALVGYFSYQISKDTKNIAEVNIRQVFFNRSLQLANEYFYKLYDSSILDGGRCIAYMNAVPDNIFVKYLHRNGPPLFNIEIVDIGNIVSAINTLPKDDADKIKNELYLDFDICLSLNKDEAFYVPFLTGAESELTKRAEIIHNDLAGRYSLFGSRYVPALDFRDPALITWFDDAAYNATNLRTSSPVSLNDMERDLRKKEGELVTEWVKNFCDPTNRVGRLLRKIERTDGPFYREVIVKELPRISRFVKENCPT